MPDFNAPKLYSKDGWVRTQPFADEASAAPVSMGVNPATPSAQSRVPVRNGTTSQGLPNYEDPNQPQLPEGWDQTDLFMLQEAAANGDAEAQHLLEQVGLSDGAKLGILGGVAAGGLVGGGLALRSAMKTRGAINALGPVRGSFVAGSPEFDAMFPKVPGARYGDRSQLPVLVDDGVTRVDSRSSIYGPNGEIYMPGDIIPEIENGQSIRPSQKFITDQRSGRYDMPGDVIPALPDGTVMQQNGAPKQITDTRADRFNQSGATEKAIPDKRSKSTKAATATADAARATRAGPPTPAKAPVPKKPSSAELTMDAARQAARRARRMIP